MKVYAKENLQNQKPVALCFKTDATISGNENPNLLKYCLSFITIITIIIIINDFLFHASKFYIGYSRRGNTNKVYVQRSKKKRYKKYKIIHKKSLYKMIILNILKIPLLLLL